MHNFFTELSKESHKKNMAPFAKLHEKLFRTSKQNNAESASIISKRSSIASRDSIGSFSKSKRGSYHIAHDSSAHIFQNYDLNFKLLAEN